MFLKFIIVKYLLYFFKFMVQFICMKQYYHIVFGALLFFGLVSFLGRGNVVFAPKNNLRAVPFVPTSTTSEAMVKVLNINSGDTIVSPLVIKGLARGRWYFEASFPIKIFDTNGMILGSGIAHAEDDWMTRDFVPFTATLSFVAPLGEKGSIVLIKDNPSGLVENEAQVRIPVIFGK